MRRERSITAEGVAWLRAVGARETDEARRNPDYLAHGLLDPRFRALGRVPGGWAVALRAWEVFAPGYYQYELARTRYLDGVLVDALAAGIDQLVLVGSGYDSRVYRFGEQLADVRTFELDRAVTLELKQRRASKRGYGDSGSIKVALDLNLATPVEALRQHGYDDDARTLFLCSGVLMYLERDAVERLLGFVAESGAGSSICFDYVLESAIRDPDSHYGARGMIRNLKRASEPYRFVIDPQDLPALLDPWELTLVSSAAPDDLRRTYGSAARPICEYMGLAHAAHRQAAPSPPS
ncbi:MAG TPA: SAM-dependent methyltransferase [Thermoleophilaceae bacterium]|nr:SAM-dependent methyltransferase [Thermoleophilaceae bacterium]